MSTANNIEPTEIKKHESAESPSSQHVAKIPAPPNDRPSLYVGDVDPSVNEEDLFELFSRSGMLASCKLNRGKKNSDSAGYAYIDYHTLSDARKALLENNFKKIRGREIRVMWCQPDSALRRSGKGNVFVKNLDESIDNRTLLDTFSLFGTVLSSKIACGPDGKSLGYGFVHFNTLEEAQKAIKKADKMHLVSKSIKVCEFLPRSSRGKKDTKFTNIYVKNFKPEQFPNENAFKKYFETFGEVTSVHFPLDKETNIPRLFGFVNYASTDVARKVVEDFSTRKDETLYVAQALSKSQRKMQLADNYQRWRREIDERTAGRNVYVKNLSENITGQRLAEHFSQFGSIEQAHVARGDNNRPKGFGFVLFSDRDSAANAIRNLNGSDWLQKRLYVGLFQRKEIRRAQRIHENNRRRIMPNHPQGMPMHQMVSAPPYFSQPPFMIQQPIMYPPNQMYPLGQPQVLNPQGQPSQAQIQQQMVQVQPSQVFEAQQLMDLNQQNTMMSKQEMDMRRQGHREAPRQTSAQTNAPEMMIVPEEGGANLIDVVYTHAHKIDPENAAKITGMIAELNADQLMGLMADNMGGLYDQMQRASDMIKEAKRKEGGVQSAQA